MTDREKLIALLDEGLDRINRGTLDFMLEILADFLLASGVTFATDNHVGGKWIPVTERLPGTEKVLITDGDIVMRGYRRLDGVWKYGVGLDEVWDKMSLRPVTHWMPLPEPPKEGE